MICLCLRGKIDGFYKNYSQWSLYLSPAFPIIKAWQAAMTALQNP
jgi:hypothetical protein